MLKAGPPVRSLSPCPCVCFERPSQFLSMSLCSAPSEPLCVFLTLPVYFSLSLAVSPLTLVSLSPTNFLLVSVPESLWVDDCLSLCLILSSPSSPLTSPRTAWYYSQGRGTLTEMRELLEGQTALLCWGCRSASHHLTPHGAFTMSQELFQAFQSPSQ